MSKFIQVDTRTFVRFWLVILGLVLAALFVWQAGMGLLILGVSLFLAIAISPLVNKLADVIPGKGRKLPTALAYVLVVGVLLGIIGVVVPAVVNETVKFVGTLPNTIGDVTEGLSGLNDFGDTFGIENFEGQILKSVEGFSEAFVRDFGNNLLNSVGAVGGFFAATILILVLTFLMLMEGPGLIKEFWKRFEQSNKQLSRVQTVLDKMAEVVAKYVTGALTVAVINGCATTLIVFIMSLLFGFSAGLALPFGLITGVMSLIPMFGSFIGGALVALLLAFNVWGAGLAFLVYIVIYLQIEANLISPRVQSKGMQLPALIVLAAVTVGVYMFGLIGAIVAIPVAGCVRVIIDEYGGRAGVDAISAGK